MELFWRTNRCEPTPGQLGLSFNPAPRCRTRCIKTTFFADTKEGNHVTAPRKHSRFLPASQGTPLPSILCFISAQGKMRPSTCQMLGGPCSAAPGEELLRGEVRPQHPVAGTRRLLWDGANPETGVELLGQLLGTHPASFWQKQSNFPSGSHLSITFSPH